MSGGRYRMTDSQRRALAEVPGARAGKDSGHGDEPFDPFRYQIKTLPRGLRAQMLRFELPLIPPEELMERVPVGQRVRAGLLRAWTWLCRLMWVRRIPVGIGLIAFAALALGAAIALRGERAAGDGRPVGEPSRESAGAALVAPPPDEVFSAAEPAPAGLPTTGEIEPVAPTPAKEPSAPVGRRPSGVARPVAPAGSTAPSTSAGGVGSAQVSGVRIKKFFIPD
jgi:hypothetical protein